MMDIFVVGLNQYLPLRNVTFEMRAAAKSSAFTPRSSAAEYKEIIQKISALIHMHR